MTRDEKIQAILSAVSSDPVKLNKLLVLLITQNIGNASDVNLDIALSVING